MENRPLTNEEIWQILGKRWNLRILKILELKTIIRFNELKHSIPSISSNVLSERLAELEELGIVKKIFPQEGQSNSGYILDERCANLKKILLDLDDWISIWNVNHSIKSKILNTNNMSEEWLSLLKKEITETEYNFIKDKLLYSDKTILPNISDQFDKLTNIIIELYGEETGNRILKKLHDQIHLSQSD